LIQDRSRLPRLVDELAAQPIVAVDTESNSLHAYAERVCLIQFSVPKKDYLVDPLAIPDLEPLAGIFASSEIEKVLHGAEYDVTSLKRDFGFHINNLFDTRMAIRTVGGEDTSLQKLLESEFGVRLNKRFQRANWGKRPLNPELLNYARLDTHYLLPLRDRLAAAVREAGRWEETLEACAYISQLESVSNNHDPEGFWNLHNARRLKPQQAAILRELWSFREKLARKRDVPLFKVLEDKVLLAVAQAAPRSQSDLENVPFMTSGLMRRFGVRILKVVERGMQAPPAKPPPRPKRVPEAILARYELLRNWRKQVAKRRGVPSDIILPREVLWNIAQRAPANLQLLRETMLPLEWRFREYGHEIMKLLKG
jgi:ribonuclease D